MLLNTWRCAGNVPAIGRDGKPRLREGRPEFEPCKATTQKLEGSRWASVYNSADQQRLFCRSCADELARTPDIAEDVFMHRY